MLFFGFLQHHYNANPAGCWQWPSHICITAVPNCTCATAQTQVSKSWTWKGSSCGRKTTLYQRNQFSSLSFFLNFPLLFFRVLTPPPFSGRGHGRGVDTQMSARTLYFPWEALAGASFTQTLQITLFIWCTYWKWRGQESATPPVQLPKALHKST